MATVQQPEGGEGGGGGGGRGGEDLVLTLTTQLKSQYHISKTWMNKVVFLTSSRLQRRSEQRQSLSSHRLQSKTWGPSSKVDTHMPEEKHKQHYHYLPSKTIMYCTPPQCLFPINDDNTAWKGVAAHRQHITKQVTVCVMTPEEKELFPEPDIVSS